MIAVPNWSFNQQTKPHWSHSLVLFSPLQGLSAKWQETLEGLVRTHLLLSPSLVRVLTHQLKNQTSLRVSLIFGVILKT